MSRCAVEGCGEKLSNFDTATTVGHIKRRHLSSEKLPMPPNGPLNAASKLLGIMLESRPVAQAVAEGAT